ncbi:MAG: ABC transporter ATP-binding protein, partial [Mogibacterium sp.]|nr:ABC transporter ATP-binding protein [Mogibacterium sp.]
MIAEVYIDMLQPKLMAQIVDDGILGLGGDGTPDISLIGAVGVKMTVIVLLGGLCGMLSGVTANICSQNFGNTIRKLCFDRIMHMSFAQTDAFTTGSLITRITNDVTQLERLVQQLVRGFIRCLMFMVVGTMTLMTLNQHFLVIVACAFPLVLLDIILVLWKTNPLFGLLQERIDRMNTVIQENVSGARVVKAFIQERREQKRFDRANQDLVDTQLRVLILMSWLRPLMNIILNLATVALIWIGAIQVEQGGMLPGEVMAGVTYLSQILNGMMMLAMIFQTMSRGMASSRRLREVIETEPEITDGSHELSAGKTQEASAEQPVTRGASVRFNGVTFCYPTGNQTEVLLNIDLDIAAGETFAIVGATGCGKTSLVNLIARFYDVSYGEVLVDGVDVRDYKLRDLRDMVAFVTQKNELFSTTIRSNIELGKPGASEEELRRAAQIAQAEEFILQQPDGYDTAVAEGGMSLSGGQKQRIAIARALLKDAKILIFDDSTSALDLRTEAALYKALEENYHGITKIIIAQRITTAQRADRIAVLSEGRIEACGTHDELLASSEIYRAI